MNSVYVVFNYSLMGSHTAMESLFLENTREPETQAEVNNLHEILRIRIADQFKVAPDHVRIVVLNWRLLK